MSRVALATRKTTNAPAYERALRDAGLEPVVYQPGLGLRLAEVEGLMLCGGSDVDPALYGESVSADCEEIDRERDDFELELLRAAIARDMPVLAICRGMQLLNVACGGSLIQHLGSERHREGDHDVVVEEPLLSLFGKSRVKVNSRHHQAVDSLGAGLKVAATDAIDGVVEGIAMPSAGWIVGVQWHPEDMEADVLQRRLFEAFAHQQHLAR